MQYSRKVVKVVLSFLNVLSIRNIDNELKIRRPAPVVSGEDGEEGGDLVVEAGGQLQHPHTGPARLEGSLHTAQSDQRVRRPARLGKISV